MVTIYSTAKVPKFKSNKKVSMNSLMTSRMAQSRNPEELKHYWTKHRETTGSKMRDLFKEYLELNNKAAKYVLKIFLFNKIFSQENSESFFLITKGQDIIKRKLRCLQNNEKQALKEF